MLAVKTPAPSGVFAFSDTRLTGSLHCLRMMKRHDIRRITDMEEGTL